MVQLQSESKILSEDLKNAIKKNKNFALNKGCVRCDAFFCFGELTILFVL